MLGIKVGLGLGSLITGGLSTGWVVSPSVKFASVPGLPPPVEICFKLRVISAISSSWADFVLLASGCRRWRCGSLCTPSSTRPPSLRPCTQLRRDNEARSNVIRDPDKHFLPKIMACLSFDARLKFISRSCHKSPLRLGATICSASYRQRSNLYSSAHQHQQGD